LAPYACYSDTSSDHIVNQLLNADADIEMKDNRGLSPLLAVCKSGHVSVLNLLLAEGANPQAVDNTNANAISICEFHNHSALKKTLLLDSPTQRFKLYIISINTIYISFCVIKILCPTVMKQKVAESRLKLLVLP